MQTADGFDLNQKLKFNDLRDFIGDKKLELRILCYPSDSILTSSAGRKKKKRRDNRGKDESMKSLKSDPKELLTKKNMKSENLNPIKNAQNSYLEMECDKPNSIESHPVEPINARYNHESLDTACLDKSFSTENKPPSSDKQTVIDDLSADMSSTPIQLESPGINPWQKSGHGTDNSESAAENDDDRKKSESCSQTVVLSSTMEQPVSSSPSPANSIKQSIPVSSPLSNYSPFSQQLPSLDDLKVENTCSLTSPIRKRKISSDSNMILKQLGVSNQTEHDSSSSDSEYASSDSD